MTRTEVIQEAKDLVAFHGPFGVLDAAEELFYRTHNPEETATADVDAVLAEAHRQAHRVIRFLRMT